MNETEQKTTKIVKQLKDLRVIIDPPHHLWNQVHFYHKTFKDNFYATLEKLLQNWARDLQKFLHDHRSQDDIQIFVERDEKDVCEVCQHEWESWNEPDGSITCTNCGALLK